MPTESHSDGQSVEYFSRLLHGNSYLWCVCVIIYERQMTDHIRRICHMVEATTSRWMFMGGMREAA
jgi:hypothetical protein